MDISSLIHANHEESPSSETPSQCLPREVENSTGPVPEAGENSAPIETVPTELVVQSQVDRVENSSSCPHRHTNNEEFANCDDEETECPSMETIFTIDQELKLYEWIYEGRSFYNDHLWYWRVGEYCEEAFNLTIDIEIDEISLDEQLRYGAKRNSALESARVKWTEWINANALESARFGFLKRLVADAEELKAVRKADMEQLDEEIAEATRLLSKYSPAKKPKPKTNTTKNPEIRDQATAEVGKPAPKSSPAKKPKPKTNTTKTSGNRDRATAEAGKPAPKSSPAKKPKPKTDTTKKPERRDQATVTTTRKKTGIKRKNDIKTSNKSTESERPKKRANLKDGKEEYNFPFEKVNQTLEVVNEMVGVVAEVVGSYVKKSLAPAGSGNSAATEGVEEGARLTEKLSRIQRKVKKLQGKRGV